jgi:hypothetical protein
MSRITHFSLACLLSFTLEGSSQEKVDFARDVQPILADNCYFCHGPDEKARKAKLRLDTREGALHNPEHIVAGKSGDSELIRRLITDDQDELMPPAKSNRKLTAKQIDTLKRWVDQGANWSQPWALTPIAKPPLPGDEGRTAIDRFVRARLKKEGLTPSSAATREAWIRRVTLDLTGLSPTPAEVDAFLKDTSANAFEKVVDRLLASDRYGERMAADWLDIARFADTHGFQSDRSRPVWPYRDWVIKAFNRNQPFDEFLTWQLAGDLLPKSTVEQRLATTFNRLHIQNEEGGIVEEEFRVAYVVDRVNTFGTAFLGLTLECSRCHDHKYDPISQKDYYQIFAFFQNIDESGQTSYFTPATPVPGLLLSTPEQDKRLAELKAKIATDATSLQEKIALAKNSAAYKAWLEKKDKQLPAIPGLIASCSFDDIKNNKVPNSVDEKAAGSLSDGPSIVEGFAGKALVLSGENGVNFPALGHFSRDDPFSLSLRLKSVKHQPRAVVLHHSMAPTDAGSRGYELLLENGRVAFGLHHMWPGNSLKVVSKKAINENEWTQVTVVYEGSSEASGLRIYINGELAECEIVRDKLTKDITYEGNPPNLIIGYRFRDNGFKQGVVDDFKLFNRSLTLSEVSQLAGKATSDLSDFFALTQDTSVLEAQKKLTASRKELTKHIHSIPEIMAMEEMKQPKPAYILKRGDYDQHGERVFPNTLAVLPPLKASSKSPNRLDLANWLTRSDHPLTARVTVNRLWQQMFGRGLVETADNFGSTGSGPTHPELLDWLAADFIEHRWDVKRLLKEIALSDTYRQSAKVIPQHLTVDPNNQWLARMPARRLTAEMLRDQALQMSGLLVEKQGGPSVYPYQPDGLWNEAMGRPNYPRSKGSDLYRRGLYTYWKRTAPPPSMTTFDAADRSVCSARRQSTSTPLQALVLLNDPQMIEAARFLGQRMLQEGGKSRQEQAQWAFRLVSARAASEKESQLLAKLFDEQAKIFAQDVKAIDKLLTVGDSKNDASLPRPELAAATSVALAILNHDAAIMRR